MRFAISCVAICLLLCSCASEKPAQSLPPETSFNHSAGRGDGLRIKLRMENGRELPGIMLDTGGPHTVLDKSLEPLLGKQIGTGTWYEPFLGGLVNVNLYKTPALYLGGTRLVTDSRVYTYDLQKHYPGLQGILGMDCLQHYCVQFDFGQERIRFLNPEDPGSEDFGKPFHLTIIKRLVIVRADCFGAGNVFFCPDTGMELCDAMIKPRLLRRLSKEQTNLWDYPFIYGKNRIGHVEGFGSEVFGGETNLDLTVMEWTGSWPDGDLLGLPFLARYKVTFNFPKRVMYLKQESAEPRNLSNFLAIEAGNYMKTLQKSGRLPGCATNDYGDGGTTNTFEAVSYPVSLTFDITRKSPPGWVDVTFHVKALFVGNTNGISVNNNLAAGDPAEGFVKQLRVTYLIKGSRHSVQAIQGKSLILPSGCEIVQADYGDLAGHQIKDNKIDPDTSTYHYTLEQTNRNGPWTLQKAWQTDPKGKLIQEYTLK